MFRRAPPIILWVASWLDLAGACSLEAAGPDESAAPTAAALAIFNRRCVECHGVSKQTSKLRLDSIDSIFRGGRSGPAIVAGRSAESLLYQKIIPGAEKRMPPPEKAEPLSAAEIDTIRRWIDSGAKADRSSAMPLPVAAAVKPGSLPRGFAPVFSLAGDPGGPRLAIARGALVEVWRLPEGSAGGKPAEKDKEARPQRIAMLAGASDEVQSLAFSPDSKRLAAGSFREVRVWETESWRLLSKLEPHAHRVLALAFSPDSKRLAAGGGFPTQSGEIKVWEIESAKEVWSSNAHSDTVFALDWSAQGKTILTGGADRATYLLDAESGKPLRRLEGHTHHVLAVAFSPDSKRAATAGADNVVRLWDLENGSQLRSCQGHRRPVTAVSFQRDGKQIASTSGDGTVRLWNAENGQEQRSFGEAQGYLQSGAYLAGGKWYAAAEQEGPVRLYDAEKNKLLLVFTREELRAF